MRERGELRAVFHGGTIVVSNYAFVAALVLQAIPASAAPSLLDGPMSIFLAAGVLGSMLGVGLMTFGAWAALREARRAPLSARPAPPRAQPAARA
jgi:hypothetical protein